MRFHVHMAITAEAWADRDPKLTLSIDADDDLAAQNAAYDLFPDLEFDVAEIEPEDQTPYCHACGALSARNCDCPDPFYARNH